MDPFGSKRVKENLRRLIRSASVSSGSVLKRHFSNNVKLCPAGNVSSAEFALIAIGFDGRIRGAAGSEEMVFNSCE